MLDEVGLLGGDVLTGDLRGGHTLEALSLLGLGLGLVAAHETEELGGLVLVDAVVELVQGRGDLETLQQDTLLALEADVTGPAHVAGQVLLGLDVTTDVEVLGGRGEQRVLHRLGGGLGGQRRGGKALLGSCFVFLQNGKRFKTIKFH